MADEQNVPPKIAIIVMLSAVVIGGIIGLGSSNSSDVAPQSQQATAKTLVKQIRTDQDSWDGMSKIWTVDYYYSDGSVETEAYLNGKLQWRKKVK